MAFPYNILFFSLHINRKINKLKRCINKGGIKMSKTILSFYNEGRRWDVSDTMDERTSRLVKYYNVKTDSGLIKSKSIEIGIQKEVFGDKEDIFKRLAGLNRSKIYNFYGKNINVKYSKKTLEPYLISTQSREKRQLMSILTFRLCGRVITDIDIPNGHVLEYGLNKDEVNLIIVTNDCMDNKFTIQFKDYRKNYTDVHNYKFSQLEKGGNLTLDYDVVKMFNEEKPERTKIKKYRPIYPTDLVLTQSIDECNKCLNDLFRQPMCKMEEFTFMEDLENISKAKREEGYKAITIFQDGLKEEEKTVEKVLDIFKEFKYIYNLNSNGKIWVLKR